MKFISFRPFVLAAALAPPLALAHVLSTPDEDILSWNVEPWVLVLLLCSTIAYALGFFKLYIRSRLGRGLNCWRAAAFASGLLALILALMSPLDGLAGALFSAHMVQHEILMLIAAPLLVLGRPLGTWMWALSPSARNAVGRVVNGTSFSAFWKCLSLPVVAWALHAIALWAWHVPKLFEAALRSPAIHAFQHGSFLISALLFWWTVLARRHSNAASGTAMLSLFTTMIHTTALGALLTLAPGLWYPSYIASTTAAGFDPLHDQQLGGLVMWVPGGAAYLIGAIVVAAGWLRQRSTAPRSSLEAGTP